MTSHQIRTITIASLTALSLLSMASASVAQDKNKDDKVITVALPGANDPYNYQDENGKWVGISADVLAYAAEKAGYTVEYRPMAFENEIPAIINGNVDTASGIYVTAERSKKLDFLPIASSYFGIVMHKDNAGDVKSWEDLCGQKIRMHFASTTEKAVNDLNAKYCPEDNGAISAPASGTIPEIVTSVMGKRVYAALDDANMWGAASRRRPELAVPLDQLGDPLYWPLAFKKGSTLRTELMPYILEFINSDRALETSKKYGMTRNVYINNPDEVVSQIINKEE